MLPLTLSTAGSEVSSEGTVGLLYLQIQPQDRQKCQKCKTEAAVTRMSGLIISGVGP
jgi:hypothetical protein